MINVDAHIIISTKWHLWTGVHVKCLLNCKVKISLSFSPENGLSTQHLSTASFQKIFSGGSKKQKCCQILLTTTGSWMPNPHFTNPYEVQSPTRTKLKSNSLSPNFFFSRHKIINRIQSAQVKMPSPCNQKKNPNKGSYCFLATKLAV